MGYERNGGGYYRDHLDRGWDREWGGRDRPEEREYRSRLRDRGPPRGYDDDRGFFERAGDELRSWFGDEEAERRRRWDERLRQREDERRYGAGSGGYGYDEEDRGGRYGGARPGLAAGGRGGRSYGGDFGAGRGAGATGTWGLGGGGDHDGWGLDPNYRAWRRRQLAELDRDYDEYRRENEQRFHDDFGQWRSTRQTQRQSLGRVQEHQEVVGSDGAHVGTVDHVRDDHILLAKSDRDAGGHHHSIPCGWIAAVDDKVRLNRTAEQAQAAWRDEEQRSGPHYLDRAFPGTY